MSLEGRRVVVTGASSGLGAHTVRLLVGRGAHVVAAGRRLDRRMKDIVTAWQMKDASTINDHTDTAYDASVLARLGALHADVDAWLAPLAAGLPRLARYGVRLAAASAAAASGDGRYVASPRVDSYHGAWFELHEDLILLAGRNRADEVAAGRA